MSVPIPTQSVRQWRTVKNSAHMVLKCLAMAATSVAVSSVQHFPAARSVSMVTA